MKAQRLRSVLSSGISDIVTPKRAFPAIDNLVVLYIAVVLLFQILFQISPVMTFMTKTPLYSIQTYLGLLGAVLIVLDLFTAKRLWQGAYSVLLFGICAMAALSSVRMISYGLRENLFKLCWAAIQFAIFYPCGYRMERERLKKNAKILYSVLLVIWVAACIVSLWQYTHQIGYSYVVNPLAKDSSVTRQGFVDNRLFGVFYTLNHAAITSVLFFVFGVMWLNKMKSVWGRLLLIGADAVLLCHIVLSGSRSAIVALTACVFCIAYFMTSNRVKRKGWRKTILSVVVAICLAAFCFGGIKVVKVVLTQVPYLVEEIEKSTTQPTKGPVPIQPEVEFDSDLLERKNLEDDSSNGRFSIWKDYLLLYKAVGPIGMSPGNYMSHIYENYPELYIVDHIKQNYPDKYESGIIFHVHNGYLMVYVSSGWIGTLLLLVFILLCVLRLIRKIRASCSVPYIIICALLPVGAVSLSAVFDEGIFFQNNPQTSIFWLALGILMMECSCAEKRVKSTQKENPTKTDISQKKGV